MFRKVKSYTKPCTHEFAAEVASMPSVKGQQYRFNADRVNYLSAQFDDGKFHTPSWAFATMNGVKYRINGHHSSTMLSSKNGSMPKTMEVHVEEFECDNEKDLVELFWAFDNPASTRKPAEYVGITKSLYGELDDVSRTNADRIATGLGFYFAEGKQVSAADKAKIIHENRDFLLWSNSYIGDRRFARAPVIAALYATYSKNQEEATFFWNLVNEDSHPNPRHPTRILSTFLRESLVGAKGAFRKYPKVAYYTKCIHAWNAFRKAENTALHFHASNAWPKVV